MHDIKFIRENPEAFDAALARRGLPARSSEILKLDEEKRGRMKFFQDLSSQRNLLSKAIGYLHGDYEKNTSGIELLTSLGIHLAAIRQGKEEIINHLKKQVEEINHKSAEYVFDDEKNNELENLLSTIPNLPADDVPEGVDENDNKKIRQHGSPKQYNFLPKSHDELGEALGLMNFEEGAKLSGSRFVVLKGALARLERALAAFMLDMHTQEFGYTEVLPPFMVKDAALYGTGQLPKFAEDLFKAGADHWLIPTAEVSLTNLVADSILDEEELPLRLTAFTPCFRAEAGSAGRDTKGMIRQHQFSKVELVSITTPEQSNDEHERMTQCAETVLKRLGLPFRTIVLCTGDMGFSARKTYDIEVWLPSQDKYREISSCSNCGDFQARRMKARSRKKGEKGNRFVHTLNGSALAVGRTMVAILENYQQADGSIELPDVLHPYMGGLTRIGGK
jgi:seryl-tRNA synthetase